GITAREHYRLKLGLPCSRRYEQMYNRQADFAEIRRIRLISLNVPWKLCSRLASKIARSAMPLPLTSKNPDATVARIYVEVRKMQVSGRCAYRVKQSGLGA